MVGFTLEPIFTYFKCNFQLPFHYSRDEIFAPFIGNSIFFANSLSPLTLVLQKRGEIRDWKIFYYSQ